MSLVNFALDNVSDDVRGDILYEGTVVDNNDPLRLGRVRVRVTTFLPAEVVRDSHCPWAAMRRSGWGGASERSEFAIPSVGSRVLVQFVGGDIYSPLYETCPPDNTTKIADLETNYPYRYGWKDPDGSALTVDIQEHTLDYVHQSGFEVHVRGSRAVDITFPYDKTEVVAQDETKNIGRDQLLDVQRDQTTTVERNVTENVVGNVAQVVGGTISISATGAITITGGTISLVGSTISLLPTPGLNSLRLGAEVPTDFVAFQAALTTLLTYINSHTHSGVTAGVANSGVPTTPLPAFVQGTHYSSTAKAS